MHLSTRILLSFYATRSGGSTAVGQLTLCCACLQIDLVGAELLGRLLGEWGLMRELTILRNTFLLGSPLLAPFCHCLFTSIAK